MISVSSNQFESKAYIWIILCGCVRAICYLCVNLGWKFSFSYRIHFLFHIECVLWPQRNQTRNHSRITGKPLNTWKKISVLLNDLWVKEESRCLWNGWTVKLIVVHPYHGSLLSNKKEQTTGKCTNLVIQGITLSEKSLSQKVALILYYYIYITFLKW